MKEKNKLKTEEKKTVKVAGVCTDRDCPLHGSLKARGRVFEGTVVSKFDRRVTLSFDRMIHVVKYERYMKARTKVHARLPDCMKDTVAVGDLIRVQECRPLSKIIHFVVMEVIRKA